MKLLIDKKYLIRCEKYAKFGYDGLYDPYAARYVFRLPESAGLPEGYTVYIDASVKWALDEHDNLIRDGNGNLVIKEYYELKNGSFRLTPSSVGYFAIMTEKREEGKRYKRYKYTAEELYLLYQNVDLNDATLAVARINIYIDGQAGNCHEALYGNRIEDTGYYIGKIKGSWFYCNELETKRLIGSHGVTILGEINIKDEAEIRKLIYSMRLNLRKHEEEYSDIHDVEDDVERVLWQLICYRTTVDETINEAVKSIKDSAEKAKELITAKIEHKESEKMKIITDFEKSLKKFCK